jgi:hypothetical protein|tara:strand:+ start:4272 stop:5366 length:1095 start_codon:yes stop_codon:yes gene_type:complete
MKIAYVIYGDIMTAKELLPVAKILEKRGYLVRNIVDQSELERATIILDKKGVLYTKDLPTSEDIPDVIICGANATAIDAQKEWTKFGKYKRIPTIWFEDTYGTSNRILDVSPDILCVVDNIASCIINKIRPKVEIKIVGKPSIEHFSDYLGKTHAIKSDVFERLHIDVDSFVVTFWSGGIYTSRVESHIKALYDLDKLTNKKVFYLPRIHPKLEDQSIFKLALKNNLNIIDTSNWDNTDELIIASNINIAEWSSNVMYISAIFDIPSVMCLFPIDNPDGVKERISMCFKDGIPPLIMENAGWGAENPEHLKEILIELMNKEDKAIEKVFKNSGIFKNLIEDLGSPDRIADVVENSILMRKEALS